MNPVNTSDKSFMDTYQQRRNHEGNAPPQRGAQQQRLAADQIEQALLEQHARSRLDLFSQQLLRDESGNQSQSFPNTASASLHDLGMSGAYQLSVPSWLQQSRQSQQADTIAQFLGQRQHQQQQQQQHQHQQSEETASFAASSSSSTFESARRLEELKQLQAALQRRTGSGMGAGGLFPSLAAGGRGRAFDQISPAAELQLAKQQQQQEMLCRPLMDLYSSSGEVSGTINRQQQQQGYIADPFGADADRKRSAEEMNDSEKKLSSLTPNKRKKKRLTPKGNSWSLPAVRSLKEPASSAVPGVHNISTNIPMKLLSYNKYWHKLSDGEMRAEIFRQKLHRGEVPITGKTKSAILLSQRKR
jgi:hypothetical protein